MLKSLLDESRGEGRGICGLPTIIQIGPRKPVFTTNTSPPYHKRHIFCHQWQSLKRMAQKWGKPTSSWIGSIWWKLWWRNDFVELRNDDSIHSLLAWSTVWKIRVEIVILLKFFPSISLRILLKYLAISKSRHHEILRGPQRSEEPNKLTKLEDVMSG